MGELNYLAVAISQRMDSFKMANNVPESAFRIVQPDADPFAN
jgi:hypothetical protein